ncbi:hypothetical protein ACLB2K_064282 [Fragaria x ananassa]
MQGLPPITCQSRRKRRQREDRVLRLSTLRCLSCKLRHYMMAFTTVVIAQSDLVKCMLSRPILRGLKGQAIADFLAHHPPTELTAFRELEFAAISLTPWNLYFDGSRTKFAASAGIAIENPVGDRFSYSFQLDFKCTNNQAEYEAPIIGLEILLDLGVREFPSSYLETLTLSAPPPRILRSSPGSTPISLNLPYSCSAHAAVSIDRLVLINSSSEVAPGTPFCLIQEVKAFSSSARWHTRNIPPFSLFAIHLRSAR